MGKVTAASNLSAPTVKTPSNECEVKEPWLWEQKTKEMFSESRRVD